MPANTPSPNDTKTHKRLLLADLMAGNRRTPLEVLQLFGCMSASQRYGDLRRDDGIPIQSRFIKLPNGKRVKEYWLEPSYINQHKEATA